MPVPRHGLPGRSTGSTALVCTLVVCGMMYRYKALHKLMKVLPQVSRAAVHVRRAFVCMESLLGAGWPFYIVAVGGGSLLVGDMVATTLQGNRPAVRVMTSQDARRMQRRTAPAFWQNLQDYRVSYGAPLLDAVEAVEVDDNGFQLPVVALNP
jgi:hypothetical protein|eukprot:COSAG06_NODE_3743_length_4953_cov_2.166049_5_plen_153_part_00